MRNQRLLTFIISLFIILTNQSKADWISGIFTPEAGIDSLERILTVRDTTFRSNFGFRFYSAGDQNDDGCNDLISIRTRVADTANYHGFLIYGGENPDTVLDKYLPRFTHIFSPLGDINYDGYDDFGGYQVYDPKWEVYYGGPNLNDTSETIYFQNLITYSTKLTDLDNNGFYELLIRNYDMDISDYTIGIYSVDSLIDTNPIYIFEDTLTGYGDNAVIGDYNSDGFPDIAIAGYLNRDTNFVKFYWGGPAFDTIPDYEIRSLIPDFGMYVVPLEDFNGDGETDFIIAGDANQRYGLYYGGSQLDSIIDIPINRRSDGSYFGSFYPANAGDINNDGFSDIVVGHVNDVTGLEEVYVYLGGIGADSIADVYFSSYDIPGVNDYMGKIVKGINDFNGDGIDDFAVNAFGSYSGEIYVFAGWDSQLVDVQHDKGNILPNYFKLKQNHPNPFNSSTSIEFSISKRSKVSLTIYNVLGEIVCVLLNSELPVGNYSIDWNGIDEDNQIMPTGVYFYQLNSNNYSESKKMILLK